MPPIDAPELPTTLSTSFLPASEPARAEPAAQKENAPFLLRLQRNPFVNSVVKMLRLHRVADFVLTHRPITKYTSGGYLYRLRSVASIVVAKEIFETEMYREPLSDGPIRRFVDLGCNIGFFPLLLADMSGSCDIQGIMIDGNQAVLEEAKEHLVLNAIRGVQAVFGLAGFSKTQKEADFYINPSSHIASTATGNLNPDVPTAGRATKITAPCIDVERAWVDRFGDAPIDVLKVDIEGMELELFRNAPGLLARSSRLLFEWHKWQVSFDDCRNVLTTAGFEAPQVVWEDAQHGLAYCRRRSA